MKHHVMLDGDIGPLCCESQTALNQRIGVGDHFSCGNRMEFFFSERKMAIGSMMTSLILSASAQPNLLAPDLPAGFIA